MRDHCVLVTDCDHYLANEAINLCRSHFKRVDVFDENDNLETLPTLGGDLLVSFLNERILSPQALRGRPNVNFHPGPPEYPGRGGASYALFDGAKTYGATAHIMADQVGAGTILMVDDFAVEPYGRCETLFARAETGCLNLLAECLATFSATGKLPPPNGRQWRGKHRTRKQFLEWLNLDSNEPDIFRAKAAAAYHSRFPGPYVMVNGLKFGLVKDETNIAKLFP